MKLSFKILFSVIILFNSNSIFGQSQSNYQIDTIYFWNDTIKKVDCNPNGIVAVIEGNSNDDVYYIENGVVKNLTSDLNTLITSPYFTDIGVRENGEVYVGTLTDLLMKDLSNNVSKVTASGFTVGQNINSIITFEKAVHVGTNTMQLTIDSNDVKSQFIPSNGSGYIEVISYRRATNSPFNSLHFVYKSDYFGSLVTRVFDESSVYQPLYPNQEGIKTGYGYYVFTSGNLVVGGEDGIIDKRPGSGQFYTTLQNTEVQKIQEWGDSELYAGTSQGLYYSDGFYQPTFSYVSLCGNYYINDMVSVADTLWIGTNAGLIKLVKSPSCDLFEAAIQYDSTSQTIFAAMSDSINFEWHFNGNIIGTDQSITYAGDGTYTLVVSNCNNCTDTLSQYIGLSNIFEHNTEELEIEIFPNPVKDDLFIDRTFEEEISFEIFNALGQVMKQGVITNSKLNLRNLPTGNYFIKLYSENRFKTFKIMKL